MTAPTQGLRIRIRVLGHSRATATSIAVKKVTVCLGLTVLGLASMYF